MPGAGLGVIVKPPPTVVAGQSQIALGQGPFSFGACAGGIRRWVRQSGLQGLGGIASAGQSMGFCRFDGVKQLGGLIGPARTTQPSAIQVQPKWPL